MTASDRNGLPNYDPVEGASELENRLRRILAARLRLMVVLDQARMELDRLNSELQRFQEEYSTDPVREEEYQNCMARILGYSEADLLAEIEEAKKNPHYAEDVLAELERLAKD